MLYTRLVSATLALARISPTVRTTSPRMVCSQTPNTYSTRQRVLDFFLLSDFCLLGKRTVTVALFVSSDSSYAVLQSPSLSDITGVQIQVLAFVFFIQQSFKAFGIMLLPTWYHTKYDLIAFLNFSMLFVAVKVSSRFVQRASTSLWHLWGLSFHNLSPALFYLLIFITGVTLARGNNKTGINDATLIELQTLTFHETMKFRKKLVINACICQEFAILPHRLLVRNIVNTFNTKKLAETRTVNYLILYLDGHSNHNNAEETRP